MIHPSDFLAALNFVIYIQTKIQNFFQAGEFLNILLSVFRDEVLIWPIINLNSSKDGFI